MAGLVSMLPTVDSRIFAIEGGNRLLPEALLKNASVVMLPGAAVAEISADDNGLFHVGLTKSSQVCFWVASALPCAKADEGTSQLAQPENFQSSSVIHQCTPGKALAGILSLKPGCVRLSSFLARSPASAPSCSSRLLDAASHQGSCHRIMHRMVGVVQLNKVGVCILHKSVTATAIHDPAHHL